MKTAGWRALAEAKRKNLASDLPKRDARNLSTMMQSQSASSCCSLTSLVCWFKLSWMFLPVACLTIFHITHFSLQGEQIAKMVFLACDSGWLLAVTGGEAHPTPLSAHCTGCRYFTETAEKERDEGRMVHILTVIHTGCYIIISFNPVWANGVIMVHSQRTQK